ncbi:MAG: hypothetical protein EU540_08610 [Promethearchaeota archaeon]|nr:MAG: hypothetical protein EU540_08610 [Candidatus Lokiarchaeota archaeon]
MVSKEELKEKGLRGFAKVVYTQLAPLNDNELFKEQYKETSLKVLLNPNDQLKAALIIFENGTVDVTEYKKSEPTMNLVKRKKLIGYDAMLQVSTQLLFDIVSGKASVVKLMKDDVKDRNIKVKGKLKLLKLLKAFTLLEKTDESS